MKKYAPALIGALFAVLILFLGVRWVTHGRFFETTDNAFLKADTINLSSKVPGKIARVAVADNAVVKAGDIIAVVEDEEYVAGLKSAEAEVAARSAALDAIRLEIGRAGAEVQGAEATIKSTEASLSLQRIERQRAAELAKENFATKRTLDQATAALKDWNGRLEGASAGLDAAKASAAIAEAKEREAAAALANAQARLDLARENLDNTRILAPKDGVVGNVVAREGQFANVGQRLASIVPLAEVYIVANFKETQIGRIRPGAKTEIEVDAFPGLKIEGVVESLSPASGAEFSLLPPENATGNFTKVVQRMPVKIRIENAPAGAALLPGLSVVTAVDTRGGDSAELFAPRIVTAIEEPRQ